MPGVAMQPGAQPSDDLVSVLSRAMEIKQQAMQITNEAAKLHDGAFQLKTETVEKSADPSQRQKLELDKARTQARRERTQKNRELNERRKAAMDAMAAELAAIQKGARKQAEAMAAAKASRAEDARKRMEAKALARQQDEEKRSRAASASKGRKPKPLFMRMEEEGEKFLALEEAAKQHKYEVERGNVRKLKTTSIIRGTAKLMSDVVDLLQSDAMEADQEQHQHHSHQPTSQGTGTPPLRQTPEPPVVNRRNSGPPSRPKPTHTGLSKEKSESVLPGIATSKETTSTYKEIKAEYMSSQDTRAPPTQQPGHVQQNNKQVSLPKITATDSGDMPVSRDGHQVLPHQDAWSPKAKPHGHRRSPKCTEAGTSIGHSLAGSRIWSQPGSSSAGTTTLMMGSRSPSPRPILSEVVAFDVTIAKSKPGRACWSQDPPAEEEEEEEEEEEAKPQPIPPLFANWEEEAATLEHECPVAESPFVEKTPAASDYHHQSVHQPSTQPAHHQPVHQPVHQPSQQSAQQPVYQPAQQPVQQLDAAGAALQLLLGKAFNLQPAAAVPAATAGAGGNPLEQILMKTLQDALLGALVPGAQQPLAPAPSQAFAPAFAHQAPAPAPAPAPAAAPAPAPAPVHHHASAAPERSRRLTEPGDQRPQAARLPPAAPVTIRRDAAVGSMKKPGEHLARRQTTGVQYAPRDAPAQYSYQANKRSSATGDSGSAGPPVNKPHKAPRAPTLEELERRKWPKSAGGTGPGLTAEQKLARLHKAMSKAPPVRSRNMAPKPWHTQTRESVSAQ